MWWMHRRVDVGRLPHDRVVDPVRPHGAEAPLVLGRASSRARHRSACRTPGYEVDAVVTCTTPALARVFSGVDTWREAVDAGDIQVTGPRALVSAMPRWFLWSPWANEMRSVSESLAAT